jgi:mono/diheme cytochrome c family protein
MKKLFFMLIALFVVAVVVTMVAMPSVKTASSIYISGDDSQPLADSIMKIVKVSCMDCHGDGGNGIANGHVNFSKWSSYKPEKQAAKANDICKMITKGAMPKKKYLEKNPDAVLTQVQITLICNWAKSLNK